MKVRATLLAIPLIVGTALAQTPPPTQPQTQTQTPPAAQTGATGAQSGTVTGTQQAPPAEMKTMTYKGTLVDLACGSGGATASAAPTAKPPASGAQAGTPAATPSSADRSSGGDCPVTANSTQLGLKMEDGKVVKFDLVGNQRAQDGLKAKKGWMKNIEANKPLKVKVRGILQGEKLIASSID
jgi:hypothetical protein